MDRLHLRALPSINDISPHVWSALGGQANPFISHAFLKAMEDSQSASALTGWTPHHLLLESADGRPLAAAPGYLKSHSQGEYVFDHSWADAYQRAGGRYYPKLLMAAPFSPVTGPRVLAPDPAHGLALLEAVALLAERSGLSSVHANFIAPDQANLFAQAGWLIRRDQQFHWLDRDYGDFAGFLAALSSRKRKNIRKERETLQRNDLQVDWLRGKDITEAHWDAMWTFYMDTGARKWGRPYLTRDAFSMLSALMGDDVLLIMARSGARYIAGALNLIGPDALYGRYWGCSVDVECLHFEICYYQAIDFALLHGLRRVEAGAQGPHKVARGYEPVATTSAHWIGHDGFRRAVASFLEAEGREVDATIAYFDQIGPYRKPD